MPIHEFTCRACGHRFEELLFGSERAVCPKCQGTQLDKLMSLFAVNAPSAGAGADLGACGAFDGPPPGCGTCGDPRGPGACSLN